MRLTVNDNAHTHQGDGTLPALLRELDIKPERVAIMLNGNVIARAEFPRTILRENDTVDILAFAAGG